jgi:hypothetical protein
LFTTKNSKDKREKLECAICPECGDHIAWMARERDAESGTGIVPPPTAPLVSETGWNQEALGGALPETNSARKPKHGADPANLNPPAGPDPVFGGRAA